MITTTYDESSLPWSYSTFANLPLQDVQSPKILARFLPDVHARALVISPSVLLSNKNYRIKVKATGYGRKGTGEARILFLTNMEPYGGNCITLPDTGKHIIKYSYFLHAIPYITIRLEK
jgi:hypothetical protein